MKEIKSSQFRIVNFFTNIQKAELINLLEQKRTKIIVLDGNTISDEKSMLVQMSSDLPISSKAILGNNWDQIMDLFWQYVVEDESKNFALLWTDTQNMLDGSLEQLVSMINMFTSFSGQVYAPISPEIPSKNFSIFLLGEGKNFE